MGSKRFNFSLVLILFAFIVRSQEEKTDDSEIDSLKTNIKQDGFVVVDTMVIEKRKLNPLAPARAGFYSAALPGLGQIYNKKYWKAPIVWAAIGTGVYAYISFDNQYNEVRTDFKRRKVGLPFLSPTLPATATDQQLERLQNDRQGDRDLTLLVTILLYALNVVDANVDAHLKQFNIDDDLGFEMKFQPYLEVNPITTDPNCGLALTIKF